MTTALTMIETEPAVTEVKKHVRKQHICPKCKVNLHDRVHRGFLIKAMFPNTIKRYKCNKCMHKYYVLT